jgi:hypothetical protein
LVGAIPTISIRLLASPALRRIDERAGFRAVVAAQPALAPNENSDPGSTFDRAMPPSVHPTFNCVAVKDPAEMGPHRDPRQSQRRRRASHRYARAIARERRPWGTGATGGAEAHRAAAPVQGPRRRMLIVGESSRGRLDHAAVVASVGVLAGLLGFAAAKL